MKTTSQHLYALVGASLLAVPAQGALLTLDFSASVNSRMQDYSGAAASYPEGAVTLGGVPFSIPSGGANVWNSSVAGGPNPRTLSIGVGVFGVDKVHTLMNTWWGETGASTYAWIRFLGSGGLDYTVALDGDSDIRDYLLSDWSNSINGTTTTEVFSAGAGRYTQVRLDKQVFDLPAAFDTATLLSIELSDDGADGFQRVFLAGATAETAVVPEPGSWAMIAGLGLAAFGISRRVLRRG